MSFQNANHYYISQYNNQFIDGKWIVSYNALPFLFLKKAIVKARKLQKRVSCELYVIQSKKNRRTGYHEPTGKVWRLK